jgi:hypothetical protein
MAEGSRNIQEGPYGVGIQGPVGPSSANLVWALSGAGFNKHGGRRGSGHGGGGDLLVCRLKLDDLF